MSEPHPGRGIDHHDKALSALQAAQKTTLERTREAVTLRRQCVLTEEALTKARVEEDSAKKAWHQSMADLESQAAR